MQATLRIKKVYFELILSGNKTVEYRDCKPFYERLGNGVTSIRLHYQDKSRQLIADVVKVERVYRPVDTTAGVPFTFEGYVWALHLTRPRLVEVEQSSMISKLNQNEVQMKPNKLIIRSCKRCSRDVTSLDAPFLMHRETFDKYSGICSTCFKPEEHAELERECRNTIPDIIRLMKGRVA